MTFKARLTLLRLRVLAELRQRPNQAGADLMRTLGVASGSLYPLLYVLRDAGLVESRLEEQEPQELGRPRRRLYKLTDSGEEMARDAGVELSGLTRPGEALS